MTRTIAVPNGFDVTAVAAKVQYVGSVEHKTTPSFAGTPRPRADASRCDPTLTQLQALRWLRQSIRRGAFSALIEGDFPRYVWHKNGDTVYEARLVNREAGTYKGYPLNLNEWPPRIGDYFE